MGTKENGVITLYNFLFENLNTPDPHHDLAGMQEKFAFK
jgi:hypothetical protein